MALYNKAVGYNAANNTHVPLVPGDIIDAVNILSTDSANAATRGTDGGLFVTAQAIFPDDQVMSGGATSSTTTTLTPTVVGTETNYQFAVDVKVSATAGNTLIVDSTGLFVPAAAGAAFTTTTATATTNTGSTPTVFFGGNTSALGTPEGWITVNITGIGARKLAFYPI